MEKNIPISQLAIILFVSILIIMQHPVDGQRESKVTLSGPLETKLRVVLNLNQQYVPYEMAISSIQQDEYIGDLLAAAGSRLITTGICDLCKSNDHGSHYFPTSFLTGDGLDGGMVDGDASSARFHNISGMAQIDSGRSVIVSDKGNRCLRKLARLSNQVSWYAGHCNVTQADSWFYFPWSLNVSNIRFCSPSTLQYIESTQKLLVLDTCYPTSYIYSIDLNTSDIVLLHSPRIPITGFTYNLARNTLAILPYPNFGGGIIEFDLNTNTTTSIVGCSLKDLEIPCSNTSLSGVQSLFSPHQIMEEKGLYIVSNHDTSGDVFLIDPLNDKMTGISDFIGDVDWDLGSPEAVAVIGDYLYIGGSKKMSEPGRYHIEAKRIKISILENYTTPSSSAHSQADILAGWMSWTDCPYDGWNYRSWISTSATTLSAKATQQSHSMQIGFAVVCAALLVVAGIVITVVLYKRGSIKCCRLTKNDFPDTEENISIPYRREKL